MRETAQDSTWSKRYALPLKYKLMSTTTHPVECHSTYKMVPKKQRVSRNMRFRHNHTQSSQGSKQTSSRSQQALKRPSPSSLELLLRRNLSSGLRAKRSLKVGREFRMYSFFCTFLLVTCLSENAKKNLKNSEK